MARKSDRNLIVGLDIGTSKVACIVGEISEDGEIEVIGIGTHPSRGLKNGVVVNLEAAVESMKTSIEEAELMADCKIREVYTGIAGSHIKSFNSQGMVAIKDKEVAQIDIDRVLETAKAVTRQAKASSLHITFLTQAEWQTAGDAGFLLFVF